MFWRYGAYEVIGVCPANDLGNGYVVQHMINGNECYA
jgi:hypothetical protein